MDPFGQQEEERVSVLTRCVLQSFTGSNEQLVLADPQNQEQQMGLIKRLLTWWNSQTIGTQIFTALNGQKVGEDDDGNVFYRNADGSRRWVIYNGEMEASRVSPEWHGWLHHTFDLPPTEDPLPRRKWEKSHKENLTGTDEAYVPPGSLHANEKVARTHYVAWKPE